MRSGKLVSKFLRETAGSVLIEYTIVFPLFITALLGTIDVCYMLYEWGTANKAAYMGARKAIVSNPVAQNVNLFSFDPTNLGQNCFNAITGASSGICPSRTSVCANGSCTIGTWDDTAFAAILTEMQRVFPRITRQNVRISYQTNGLGYVPGQTGNLPMNVTVSIQCMTHQFYFIDALMNWIYSAPACNSALQGPIIPTFASTLQSEDLQTN